MPALQKLRRSNTSERLERNRENETRRLRFVLEARTKDTRGVAIGHLKVEAHVNARAEVIATAGLPGLDLGLAAENETRRADFVLKIGNTNRPRACRIGKTGRPDFFLNTSTAGDRERDAEDTKVFALIPGAAKREAAEAEVQTEADFFRIGIETSRCVTGGVETVNT